MNLSEILKGHEGETFYSPVFGKLSLVEIDPSGYLQFNSAHNDTVVLESDGKFYEEAHEIAVYPDANLRDWEVWYKMQNETVVVNKAKFLTFFNELEDLYEKDRTLAHSDLYHTFLKVIPDELAKDIE